MAIFSDEQLDAILNEKGVTDRIAENEEKIKAAKDKAVENFKKNTSRKNKKKTKFKLDENGNIIDIDDPEFQYKNQKKMGILLKLLMEKNIEY